MRFHEYKFFASNYCRCTSVTHLRQPPSLTCTLPRIFGHPACKYVSHIRIEYTSLCTYSMHSAVTLRLTRILQCPIPPNDLYLNNVQASNVWSHSFLLPACFLCDSYVHFYNVSLCISMHNGCVMVDE